jgi:hypothetical protein
LLESLSVQKDASVPIATPIQALLHGFFSALRANIQKIEALDRLIETASRSFHGLLSTVRADQSATAGKAEGWLDILGLALTWVDKENVKGCLVPVERLLRAIGTELVVSLDVAQNRKKVSCHRGSTSRSVQLNLEMQPALADHFIGAAAGAGFVSSVGIQRVHAGSTRRSPQGSGFIPTGIAARRYLYSLFAAHLSVPKRNSVSDQARFRTAVPSSLDWVASATSLCAFPAIGFNEELCTR